MSELEHTDIVSKTGEVTIPPGYRWCIECNALTPHTEDKFSFECRICQTRSGYGAYCPKCGYDADDEVETDLSSDVTLHHSGCHCAPEVDEFGVEAWDFPARQIVNDFFGKCSWFPSDHKILKLHRQYINQECGCPKIRVFRHLHTFGHWAHQTMPDGEWDGGCKIRCPICGTVFTV